MTVALLIELLFKSGLIAGAGLGLSVLLRTRPVTEGVDILRVAVLLLLALPLLMLLLPALSLPVLPTAEPVVAIPSAPVWAGNLGEVGGVAVSASVFQPSPALVAACVWGVGVLLVLSRLVIGLLTLVHWTRTGQPVTAQRWTAPLETLSGRRKPRLVASPAIPAPLSWGLPPGVVLISEELVSRPDCARAVLAHELAHIRRRDWLFLLLSRMAVALFWFNPLVWALHLRLAALTEEAADASALRHLDPAAYARTLVGLAAEVGHPAGRSAALGLTGSARSLSKRIARIMKTPRSLPSRPFFLALTVGGLVAVATPMAAIELTARPAEAAEATVDAPAAEAPRAPALVLAVREVAQTLRLAPPAPPAPPPPPAGVPRSVPPAPPAPPVMLNLAVPPAPPAPPVPPAPPAPPRPWQDGRQASEVEAAMEAARSAHADAARAQAEAARARAEVRAHAPEIAARAREAEAAASRARDAAVAARERAAAARVDAARARADGRVQMARGADEMERGAREMREEARRLQDPAYRAEVIERQRVQGHPVTDAELRALSGRLSQQADELVSRAGELRNRSREA